MNEYDSRVYVIDSSKRISGTSSNFSISIDIPNLSDFDRIALNQFSCPRSYYDVEEGFNTFILKEGTTQVQCIFPQGMYNVYTLISTMTSLLNAYSPNGLIYSIEYPNSAIQSNNNKLVFIATNPTLKQISLIFNNYLFQQFGFNSNSTNLFSNLTSTSVLESVNSISVSSINRLFLSSNACGLSPDNLLQEILIAGQFPSCAYIYYENINYQINSKVFTNPQNNSFEFTLYDRYGNVVNLHGLEIVFSITLYKKDRTNELLYNYYKLKNQEKLLFN
jgi:hypothetical protein